MTNQQIDKSACLNCGNTFQKSDNYCSHCGQDTSTHRLNTSHVLHDYFHSFTHTDKGFFYLIPALLKRPGIIAREYNEGKRKTYFNPYTFMLIIVAISTLLVAYNSFMTIGISNPDPRIRPIMDFTNKHFNIIVLFGIPITAFLTSRFFRKKINFAESMTLMLYSSGERSIFFILVIVPLVVLAKINYYAVVYSYIFLFAIYYGWACCQYFNDYRVWNILKGVATVLLTQLIIVIIFSLIITVSIFISHIP